MVLAGPGRPGCMTIMPPALRRLLVLVALPFAVLVAGCGDSNDQASAAKPTAAAAKSFNGTDARFAGLMTPHHTGGVELGKLAVLKGKDPAVRRLGQGIVDEQSRELKQLKLFLRDFRATASMPRPIEARDMMDMEELRKAKGAAFDRMWLQVIGGHHAAAIQMALMERSGGKDRRAVRLASSIIASQSTELTQFNRLLRSMQK